MTTKTKKNVEGSKNTDTKKKVEKTNLTVSKKVESDMFGLYRTTYYYWRFWTKNIFESSKIKARFVKDEKGFGGTIFVLKSEVDKAKKMLKEYSDKHKDEVDLFW